MKADERHRLKTNELADSLEHVPEFFQTHSKNITLGIVIVIVLLLAVFFWRKHQADMGEQQAIQLGLLMRQIEEKEQFSALYAQDSKTGAPYDATSETTSLRTLAESAREKGISVTALLEQADALHSQLLYSNVELAPEQKADIYQQIQQIYNQVLQGFSMNPHATAAARLGLGIIAEETGSWDKAKELYQSIIDLKDTDYAGTVYPEKAEQRLAQLKDVSEPIVFPPAPPVSQNEGEQRSAESPAVEPQAEAPKPAENPSESPEK